MTPKSFRETGPTFKNTLGHSTDGFRNDRFRKIAVIVFLVVGATALHYGIDVQAGAVHDVLTRSYYIPIVLAGLWFGPIGGLVTSVCVTIVFFPHAIHGWDAPYTLIFRLIEILMYNVIGLLTGLMSATTKKALKAEKSARIEQERAYEDLKENTELLIATEQQLRRSEKLAALGNMSAGLAHEIRNPLATIKTSVEILQDRREASDQDGSTETSPDFLDVLQEETDRLNRILTEFLQFARAETIDHDQGPTHCVVGDVVAGTAGLLRPKLEAAGVDVSFDAAALDVEAAVSEDHLRQVFLNLFLNSSEFLPEGGSIRIESVGLDDDSLTFAIEDTGPGIVPDLANSIFDPFFSTKEGGVGLGLSIVARLLDSSGGDIRFDQSCKMGARFLVTLPRKGT